MILKKIKKIIDIIIGALSVGLAVFGLFNIKKKKNKPSSGAVKPDEVKPGTTVVKPGEIKNRDNVPFRNKNKIKTKDGKEIESPIPDNKVKEVIKNKMEINSFKPEHDNVTDDILAKIAKYKKGKK